MADRGDSKAKRGRVEQRTTGVVLIGHKGWTSLPDSLRRALVGFLRPKDIAHWWEATLKPAAGEELQSLYVERVYTRDEFTLLSREDAFLDDLRLVEKQLLSLRLDETGHVPPTRTWSVVLRRAPNLKSLEWTETSGAAEYDWDVHMARARGLPNLLSQLRVLKLVMPNSRSPGSMDRDIGLNAWFPSGGSSPSMQALTLDFGRWSMGSAALERFAQRFERLHVLHLSIDWTDAGLQALANALQELTHLHLGTNQAGGEWMTADTIGLLIRSNPKLLRIELRRSELTLSLELDEPRQFKLVDDLSIIESAAAPAIPVATLAALVTRVSPRWAEVTLTVPNLLPILHVLVEQQVRTKHTTTIDSLVVQRAKRQHRHEWEDDGKTWPDDALARHLLEHVAREVHMSDNQVAYKAPRFLRHLAVGQLWCNQLMPESVYAWIRAGVVPLVSIHIGGAETDDDGRRLKEGSNKNPLGTPTFTDELCTVVTSMAHVHTGLTRLYHIGRSQNGVESWDGRKIRAMIDRLDAHAPRILTDLILHDAGRVTHLDAWLSPAHHQPPRGVLSLRTRETLTPDVWTALCQGDDLREVTISFQTREEDEEAPLPPHMVLDGKRWHALADANPHLDTLRIKSRDSAMMQPSHPDSDWTAIGRLESLDKLVLGTIPSPGITIEELEQMHWVDRNSFMLNIDPQAPYHARHRWPTHAQWAAWWTAPSDRPETLVIGEQKGYDVRALTWSDVTLEDALVLPPTETKSSADVAVVVEEGVWNVPRLWCWLAQQVAKAGVDVCVIVTQADADEELGTREYAFGSKSPTAVRVWYEYHGTVFQHGGIDVTMNLAQRYTYVDADLLGGGVGSNRPMRRWRDLCPVGWNTGNDSEQERLGLEMQYTHLCLLNPGVPAEKLAQYLFRPGHGTFVLNHIPGARAYQRRMLLESAGLDPEPFRVPPNPDRWKPSEEGLAPPANAAARLSARFDGSPPRLALRNPTAPRLPSGGSSIPTTPTTTRTMGVRRWGPFGSADQWLLERAVLGFGLDAHRDATRALSSTHWRLDRTQLTRRSSGHVKRRAGQLHSLDVWAPTTEDPRCRVRLQRHDGVRRDLIRVGRGVWTEERAPSH